MSPFAGRIEAVRAALGAAGADALVVSKLVNVRYLTGFAGSNGVVVVGPDSATFFTDFRYVTASEPIREFMQVELADRDALRFVAGHLDQLLPGDSRIGFEAAHLTFAAHAVLADALGREPVPTREVVERLRAVKDAGEVESIRRSAALIEPVYAAIAEQGLEGRTERDVAWSIRELFHGQGSDQLAFDSIVASHERGAMPHADPSDAQIGAGTLVTIDIGCVLDGYASDCTRTFATGGLPAELREIYEVCLAAQLAGLDAVRPGVAARDADAAARTVIAEAGYGDHFGHPLGHGVGLEIHEGPRLSAASDATLEPGMVVTVEPGIYLPGRGGVRIEDLVVVTATGCERLTAMPKELTVLW